MPAYYNGTSKSKDGDGNESWSDVSDDELKTAALNSWAIAVRHVSNPKLRIELTERDVRKARERRRVKELVENEIPEREYPLLRDALSELETAFQ